MIKPILITLSLVFSVMFSLSFESGNDLKNQNLFVLEQAVEQTPGGGTTVCFGTTSVCYIFGCTRVNTCQPDCPLVKTDYYSFMDECEYGNPQ